MADKCFSKWFFLFPVSQSLLEAEGPSVFHVTGEETGAERTAYPSAWGDK